jgi:hypothetical protein
MNIPQISQLRIGIVQNISSDTRQAVYDDPFVYTNPQHGMGSVPSRLVETVNVGGGGTLNDFAPGAGPLYATPQSADGTIDGRRISDDSVAPPDGTAATTIDDPSESWPSGYILRNVTDGTGTNVLGTARYALSQIVLTDTFTDYCVVCEQSPTDLGSYRVIAPLRQTGWSLNVVATAGNNGGWAVTGEEPVLNGDHGGGSVPTIDPVLSLLSYNNTSAMDVAAASPEGSDDETILQF